MVALTPDDQRHSDLDHRLVEVAQSIKVLSSLSVSSQTQDDFVASVKRGDPQIPHLPKPEVRFDDQEAALTEILAACDPLDPLGKYVADTTQSYLHAIGLIHNAGTPEFLFHSFRLYGHPSDPFPGTSATILQFADRFLEMVEPYLGGGKMSDPESPVPASTLAYAIQNVADTVFKGHNVEVVLDPSLSSKAAAGASRVRIRESATFTHYDVAQLINHELLVHTLTSINGRQQPYFPSFGLGSPRTTETQEGVAVFSELITNSMDLMRLRRLALRVRAIAMGLEGANFLEVYQFFLDSGYDMEESAHSAFRIFRGGDPSGGIVFTKDMVYLGGLLSLQKFLASSVESGSRHLVDFLFSGRMALTDLSQLETAYQEGKIVPPSFRPDWARDFPTLATQLIFNSSLFLLDTTS